MITGTVTTHQGGSSPSTQLFRKPSFSLQGFLVETQPLASESEMTCGSRFWTMQRCRDVSTSHEQPIFEPWSFKEMVLIPSYPVNQRKKNNSSWKFLATNYADPYMARPKPIIGSTLWDALASAISKQIQKSSSSCACMSFAYIPDTDFLRTYTRWILHQLNTTCHAHLIYPHLLLKTARLFHRGNDVLQQYMWLYSSMTTNNTISTKPWVIVYKCTPYSAYFPPEKHWKG